MSTYAAPETDQRRNVDVFLTTEGLGGTWGVNRVAVGDGAGAFVERIIAIVLRSSTLYSGLECTNTQLRQQQSSLQSDFDQLKTSNTELKQQPTSLRSTYDELKIRNNESRQQHVSLQITFDQQQLEHTILERKCSRLEALQDCFALENDDLLTQLEVRDLE